MRERIPLTPEQFATINSEPMIGDLREWGGEYAQNSNGQLVLLDYRPDLYAGQDDISVEGLVHPPFSTDNTAAVAKKPYPELLAMLRSQAQETRNPVDAIGTILNSGGNVILVTNHSDLIDIAIAQAGLYSTLHANGYEDFKTGIIISKMIAFLGYNFEGFIAPCVDALKDLETEIFLSFPRTESARQHLVHGNTVRGRTAVKLHNFLMRKRLENLLEEGGVLLAMAASGTTDKPKATDPSTITMGEIGKGTLELMQLPDTFVVPLAIYYAHEEKRVMRLTDMPRSMKNEAMCHRAMGSIATALSVEIPDFTFSYDASTTGRRLPD